jgi:hypothetical protein
VLDTLSALAPLLAVLAWLPEPFRILIDLSPVAWWDEPELFVIFAHSSPYHT